MHPVQWEIFRKMTPTEKLNGAAWLRASAWDLKAAYLKSRHPDWSDEEIHEAVKKNFMDARG